MPTTRNFLTIFIVSLVAGSMSAQQVVQCPTQAAPLQERWTWALNEGTRAASGSECWIGYCIKRLMGQDSYIGSGNMYSGSVVSGRPSLYELLSGVKSSDSHQGSEWRYSQRSNVTKMMKDVALLFRMSGTRDDGGSIVGIELSNMELHVDLKGKPLLWLGGVEDGPSVVHLERLFGQLTSTNPKRQLVRAVGIHQWSAEKYPFLKSILNGDESDDVRAQAAFWLGEENNPDALEVLVRAARNDRAIKVREQAVFAVSRMESEASTDALIDLALKTTDSRVRSKAAFWLGEKASQKAVRTLEGIIADDEEADVQRQALYALARIHDSEGIDRLIRIAKTHPNPRIRKQAIQCLGQTDDPKALNALIEIVRK